ncbi:MAG TPA: hypothetical protein VND80_04020 [Steroidobacteraceae bacterium]|nr:hypothetical protein [Steroidobacteraceae bacterium]
MSARLDDFDPGMTVGEIAMRRAADVAARAQFGARRSADTFEPPDP